MSMHMYLHVCMFICTCVYMYVCIYTHTYTHTRVFSTIRKVAQLVAHELKASVSIVLFVVVSWWEPVVIRHIRFLSVCLFSYRKIQISHGKKISAQMAFIGRTRKRQEASISAGICIYIYTHPYLHACIPTYIPNYQLPTCIHTCGHARGKTV